MIKLNISKIMNKLKPYNSNRIISNVKKVLKTRDMNDLSKQAYDFLYQQSGFIAHYNHYGFIEYYKDNIEQFILDMMGFNKDADYFGGAWFRDKYGDEYVDSKVATLRGIYELLPKM